MSFSNAEINKNANIYFDGKVTSRSITTSSGERKSLGVMLSGSYHFGTGAPEIMEIQSGTCRVRLDGSSDWNEYSGGQSFTVPGNSGFDIEAVQLVDYICHFG